MGHAGRVRRPAILVTTALLVFGGMTTAALASSGALPGVGEPTSTSEPATSPPTTAEPATTTTVAATTTTTPATTTTKPPPTTTTAPKPPVGVVMAKNSIPSAGWFHVVNRTLPAATRYVRYQNVNRTLQTGVAAHGPGPLNLWFRAPGPKGSKVTIRLQALDAYGRVVAEVGRITLTTGNTMLPLPRYSGTGRRMVVHSDAQQVWLVEADGRVSDTFLMSGRRIPTASGYDQAGTFKVYSRSTTMYYCAEGRCGTANFMVRYQRTRSSVGTHSLPTERGVLAQGVQDLGWPLSHGCTRLEYSKAAKVFMWAPIGTTVVVL